MAPSKGLSFFLAFLFFFFSSFIYFFFGKGNLYFICTTSRALGLFITAAASRKPKGDMIKPDGTAKHII